MPYDALTGLSTFETALAGIKRGEKWARRGWNGKGAFVFLVPGSRFQVSRAPLLDHLPEGSIVTYRPHIDMKAADGAVVPWLASQTDLLADDWEVVW